VGKKVLFGSSIYSYDVDSTSYDKEKVISHILDNYKIDKYRNAWDNESNMHHSYDDWSNIKFNNSDDVNSNILLPVYEKLIKNFFSEKLKLSKEIKYRFEIANYTCFGDSQYMKPHNHLPDYIFTCVHYLQFDPIQHTGIRLFNNSDYGSYARHLFPTYYDTVNTLEDDNSFMFEYFDYTPKEDEMIIFNGMLPHAVPKQKNTTKPRISVITNIKILPENEEKRLTKERT
tara:strand:- start:166 stop:855 length:690 start_codon:yes stop_codon:yes gene_type:complete